MKKLFQKSKPKVVAAKPGRPKRDTDQKRSDAMNDYGKQKDPEFEEKDKEKDDEQDDSESEDRSNEQGKLNPSQSGGSVQARTQGGPYHTGASGNDRGSGSGGDGGGGDEEEKTYVLGYGEAVTKLSAEYYPREEVWKTLVEEARAQEVYETEDYDRRIGVLQQDQDKIEKVMQGKYDPDKLRESAKKLNELRTDPDQVKQQSEQIQQLRKKLYPQPHISGGAGAGGGGGSRQQGTKQYPGSSTGGAGQSAPPEGTPQTGNEGGFANPR